ncbi:hypothetical protein BDV23DRAFT_47161 [Aspergillus alliaceus]|uniref:Uncharacterized protein n=1 Tax=Petromyces alliaceus TaxID=209559 RepID=A0A5N7CRG4_PETAA|nr:hypothetical protein BDV23DRAFT_47161 [Aspergillus alliaceus]
MTQGKINCGPSPLPIGTLWEYTVQRQRQPRRLGRVTHPTNYQLTTTIYYSPLSQGKPNNIDPDGRKRKSLALLSQRQRHPTRALQLYPSLQVESKTHARGVRNRCNQTRENRRSVETTLTGY